MDLRSAIKSPTTDDPLGTVGVDMAVNPLSLGTSKLRSAVNLRFEEGVIKTRPGFIYQNLGVSGQFQGSLHYSPSKGISARSFADNHTALVIVIKGKLYLLDATYGTLTCNSTPLCGDYDFNCRGPVCLYQAENWLIVQNRQSATYYWDGSGCLKQSPGMGTPVTDEDPVMSPAGPPALGDCFINNTFVQFTVLDHATDEPIEGATVTMKVGTRPDYAGETDEIGVWRCEPVPKSYSYQATKEGYTDSTATPLEVLVNRSEFVTIRLSSVGTPGATFGVLIQTILDGAIESMGDIEPMIEFTMGGDPTDVPINGEGSDTVGRLLSLDHLDPPKGFGINLRGYSDPSLVRRRGSMTIYNYGPQTLVVTVNGIDSNVEPESYFSAFEVDEDSGFGLKVFTVYVDVVPS